ncbi:MAG: hypothetical protein A3F84_27755 [Candidatus Handelsmanbacteria bacterium RIFCSPLOWO2_12_FULL_64_10]|uniref:Uncharacterized protein n=1 Tax=Handelsmanbacteria sp. (strain RIFCSPLOWO2_12_FULL_64_10) TaxID=1817868 RepID=A0A1F6C4H7_HANXR|nr:MAG: hypothetical protein A3F84_27755 [Candidatus Handelsmanbacteria bacterium RIFCSPLOWO2_12_FULL_64_10]
MAEIGAFEISLGPVACVVADLIRLTGDVIDELPVGHEARRKLEKRRLRIAKIVQRELKMLRSAAQRSAAQPSRN